MGLQAGPEDGEPRASLLWRWLTNVWRWLSQPIGAGQGLEVIGLLVAAGVAVDAIHFSSQDSRAQLQALLDQGRTTNRQLDEMRLEQRAWASITSIEI
jgi:hypothetical protein